MQRGSLNPAWLLPEMRVGPWRIVGLRGGGAYGAVYLAQGVEPEATGVVALKVARTPREPRFAREVELLSRLHHPAVPRLIAQGQWESPAGQPHPYFVMEWIEGLPLYEWARFRGPTSRQVLRVLADLARALEATHAARSVHRDVKGENVLVRLSDAQGFLIDFGSASYHGADTLTWQVFPPGTPAYRSPEAIAFAVNILGSPVKQYTARPTDDVFALGVTGYRLVTGQYPPTADPLDEGTHVWQEGGSGPQPARELNVRCCSELGGIISRMLSLDPEARGSARELAEALEQAASDAGPEADASLFVPELAEAQEHAETDAEPEADAPLFVWESLPPVSKLADVLEQPAKKADEPVLPSECPPPVDVEATAPEEAEDAPRSSSLHVPPPSRAPLFPAVLAVTVVLGIFWGLKAARMYFLNRSSRSSNTYAARGTVRRRAGLASPESFRARR